MFCDAIVFFFSVQYCCAEKVDPEINKCGGFYAAKYLHMGQLPPVPTRMKIFDTPLGTPINALNKL